MLQMVFYNTEGSADLNKEEVLEFLYVVLKVSSVGLDFVGIGKTCSIHLILQKRRILKMRGTG